VFIFAGNQPNIHPGSIPSTGRRSSNSGGVTNQHSAAILNTQQYTQNGVIPGLSSPLGSNFAIGGLANVTGIVPNQILMAGTPTSTQNVAQQQLIGGAISPSLITIQTAQQSQVSLDHSSTSGSSISQSTQNNPSNNSGELGKGTVVVAPQSQQQQPPILIDAPMLSAMQQMFSTIDPHPQPHQYHQHQNPAAATIYFN